MAVPYTFGSATTSIPLSQLDSNFATGITLGNTAIQLGNTVTTLNNMTFANATVSSGNVTVLNATVTNDASINGLTVGKGGGAVATTTALGVQVMGINTGANNTGVGYQALGNNTSGASNTGIGNSALNQNTTASNNTAVGYQAAYTSTTATGIVAVGWSTLYSNTGNNNTAVGANVAGTYNSALYANTTGTENAAFGTSALVSNTTGTNNVAVGSRALVANTTASNNTALGYQALSSATGANNVALGADAGGGVTTGVGNVFIGQRAGNSTYVATTGSYNIHIGAAAQGSATGNGNEIVIGTNNPTGKGSSTGFINANGGAMYQGNNTISWTVASDRRLKKNIVDNTEGLDIISQIRVRNFEYRTAEEVTELPASQVIDKQGVQLGVIAQELLEVCGDCVKTESTGVMSVNSDNLTWHMINAIKDLKALVDAQATEITALKAKVGI